MHLDLIRHTQPEVESGVCYGQSDLPLSKAGLADIDRLSARLPSSHKSAKHQPEPAYQAVFSSPLQRCTLLAQALNSPQASRTDPRLLELDFGDWELQRWQTLGQTRTQAWADDFVHVAPEGGESFLAMYQRVEAFWQQLRTAPDTLVSGLSLSDTQPVAVVTHAGVIRATLALLMSIPLDRVFQLELGYGCVIQIQLQAELSHTRLRFIQP